MAEPGFTRVHYLLEFCDDGLGVAVSNRIHSNRLPAHPIDVETSDGVQCRLTLGTGAYNQKEFTRRVGSNGARTGGKAFEQPDSVSPETYRSGITVRP